MEAFKQNGVIPDVIDAPPKELASLTYEGDIVVKPGDVLTPTQVKAPPKVEWPTEKGAFYTLIMNDPDAPSRVDPKFGEFHHWLVVNIPENNVSEGETMSEYVGSGPPQGTGLHRYVFLVYKQNGGRKQDFPGLSHLPIGGSREQRRQWKVRDFAKKYNLGEPVAGNFYQAEWDDYVPKVHEKLGIKK